MRLLVLTVLLLVGLAAHPAPLPVQHATAHHIEQSVMGGMTSSRCSATAIGPHALLTASHCEVPTDQLRVDDEPARIVKIIRDEDDHSIYLLSGITFDHWAAMAGRRTEIGEDVYIFGNPEIFEHLYRKGYISGHRVSNPLGVMLGQPPINEDMIDLNGGPGDSGSAIFSATDNRIVGVVSTKYQSDNMKMMGAFPLHFTAAQLETAVAF